MVPGFIKKAEDPQYLRPVLILNNVALWLNAGRSGFFPLV